jgi:TonB family protein
MAQNPGFPWVRTQVSAEKGDRNESLQLQKLRTVYSAFENTGADASLALDLLLHELAVEARSIPGVGSCAIALWGRERDFVCRAAAGPSAPGLGIRIRSQDGLSAECVRTGTQQICQDTESDPRVDAAVCRAIAVRSLVILPLFLQQRMIGIIEAFAPAAHAFDKASVELLANLGRRIVETVAFAETRLQPPVQPSAPPPDPIQAMAVTENPEPVPEIHKVAEETLNTSPPVPPRRSPQNLALALVTLIAGVVALAALLRWVPQENTQRGVVKAEASSRQPGATESQAAPNVGANSGTASDSPSVARPVSKPASSSPPPKLQSAPANEKNRSGDVANAPSGDLVVYEKGKVVYRAGPVASPGNSSVTSAAETEKLDDTSDPVATPDSTLPVAAGFTGGKLIHHVTPVYSAETRELRLQGAVVLEGVIGTDGAVRDIRVVSGDARLADTAVDAVRQWRYEPFRSNGEPVDMLSTITVHFR